MMTPDPFWYAFTLGAATSLGVSLIVTAIIREIRHKLMLREILASKNKNTIPVIGRVDATGTERPDGEGSRDG